MSVAGSYTEDEPDLTSIMIVNVYGPANAKKTLMSLRNPFHDLLSVINKQKSLIPMNLSAFVNIKPK